MANIASDLETRFRAVTLSSRALNNTAQSTNNPKLSRCLGFTTTGPSPCIMSESLVNPDASDPIEALEIRDAANQVLIPLPAAGQASTKVMDSGQPCSDVSNVLCRWRVSAFFQPLGCSTGSVCAPSTFDLVMKLEYDPPPSDNVSTPLAPRRVLAKAMPKEMFSAPQESTTYNPGEVMTGLDAQGFPICSNLVPTGAVMAFDLAACPSGWSEMTQARGRAIIGTNPTASGGISQRNLRAQGGAEMHTLTVAQMPSHSHPVPHVWDGASGGGPHLFYSHPSGASGTRRAQNTDNAGGNQPHNNMMPFLVLRYCRKD